MYSDINCALCSAGDVHDVHLELSLSSSRSWSSWARNNRWTELRPRKEVLENYGKLKGNLERTGARRDERASAVRADAAYVVGEAGEEVLENGLRGRPRGEEHELVFLWLHRRRDSEILLSEQLQAFARRGESVTECATLSGRM